MPYPTSVDQGSGITTDNNGNVTVKGWIGDSQSSSVNAIATGGTITTTNVGVARISPTAAVTGLILSAGIQGGQTIIVVNESAFTTTFAVSATSNVADGVANTILPASANTYVWDSGTSKWYGQSVQPVQSSSAAATASSGTIATAGLTLSRVNPTAAITGVILQQGTFSGQLVTVVNESAFSITFAAATTSFVADGTSDVIATLTARTFVWDSSAARWFRVG